MKVLVAGCGFAGGAIAERSARAGHVVWALRRDASRLPSTVRPIGADLTDRATLRLLPDALDVVVYSASPDSSEAAAYERTYVVGVRNLLTELEHHSPGLRRFLLTSSTGVYGRSDGAWVDESTPPEPDSARSEMLLEGERIALSSTLPATVVRLAGIYGPGRRRLLDSIRAGKAECVDGPPQYGNRIHRDDVAGAVLHLAMLANPAGLYLGVDNDPAERCEVLRWLAARLAAPAPRSRAATKEDLIRSNKRCSNRLLAATGYAFRFPTYREGYAEVLAGLGK